ncbi:hypothetical protein AZOA_34180 [Azoarcus sp. Aa7]|nr:hypothetical protein [Azoarcus sp. Aa7]
MHIVGRAFHQQLAHARAAEFEQRLPAARVHHRVVPGELPAQRRLGRELLPRRHDEQPLVGRHPLQAQPARLVERQRPRLQRQCQAQRPLDAGAEGVIARVAAQHEVAEEGLLAHDHPRLLRRGRLRGHLHEARTGHRQRRLRLHRAARVQFHLGELRCVLRHDDVLLRRRRRPGSRPRPHAPGRRPSADKRFVPGAGCRPSRPRARRRGPAWG